MAPHTHPPRSSARRAAAAAVALALLAGCLMAPALARDREDHERARRAMTTGVLERLEREHPGQVLEVELEQDDGQWVYEVKLLQNDGQLVKIKLDAKTAAVLSSRARAGHSDRARPR